MAWNSPGNGNNNDRQAPPCLETTLRKWFGRGPSSSPKPSKAFSYSLISLLCGLGIIGLWAMSGVYSVSQNERAVILRFGKYQTTEASGVHWYPRFIDTKYQIDVATPRSLKINQDVLTKDADLVSAEFVLKYRISDLNAYLMNAANPDQLLNQIAVNLAQQVVASHSLVELTTQQDAIASALRQQIMQAAQNAGLGITLTELTMQPLQVPSEFKQSLAALAKAKTASDTAADTAKTEAAEEIATAETNAGKIVIEANTYKQQAVLEAQSDVAEFNALLPLYLKSPQLVTARLYYDTLQQVMENSHIVITDVNNFTYQADNKTSGPPAGVSQTPSVLPTAAPASTAPADTSNNAADSEAKTAAYQRWQETQ